MSNITIFGENYFLNEGFFNKEKIDLSKVVSKLKPEYVRVLKEVQDTDKFKSQLRKRLDWIIKSYEDNLSDPNAKAAYSKTKVGNYKDKLPIYKLTKLSYNKQNNTIDSELSYQNDADIIGAFPFSILVSVLKSDKAIKSLGVKVIYSSEDDIIYFK